MAINPGNAQAQALVNGLKAQGMSYAEIGRRVGRNSSLISQIGRKGNKGASMVSALQSLAGGATSAKVARRQTKGGEIAKTRKGIKQIPGTDNITIPTKRGDKTLRNGIQSISGKGKYLKWNLKVSWLKTISDKRYKDANIEGHLPSGWTSDDLAKRIAQPTAGDNWKPGDARQALKEIALSQNQGAYTSAGAIQSVHLYSTDRASFYPGRDYK